METRLQGRQNSILRRLSAASFKPMPGASHFPKAVSQCFGTPAHQCYRSSGWARHTMSWFTRLDLRRTETDVFLIQTCHLQYSVCGRLRSKATGDQSVKSVRPSLQFADLVVVPYACAIDRNEPKAPIHRWSAPPGRRFWLDLVRRWTVQPWLRDKPLGN